VRVLGLDPATDPDAVRHRVGIQLQQAVLPQRMRVAEAMAVFAAATPTSRTC
jgi:ABC-2 type transport system ATP-binding protein